MLKYIVVAAIFAAVGYFVGIAIAGRRHIKAGMFDEIDRHHRTKIRRIVGQVSPSFSDSIRALSPGFCEIYEQANDAESYQLSDICGLGYGRALEFLVKDYAKARHPDAASTIETTPLGACITTYITDADIQEAARLASWLRNDQAHYVRRFHDKDIPDLKGLIAMTVAFIGLETHKRTAEAVLSEVSTQMRAPQNQPPAARAGGSEHV